MTWRHLVILALIIAAAATLPVAAQVYAPEMAPVQSPACARLENQLAVLDRGGADRETAGRYEQAAARQQSELDRTVTTAQRMGCQGGGFFVFGGGPQPPQCDQLNNQIQRMRMNLDRIQDEGRRYGSGGPDLSAQRSALLVALGQNGCGPQYHDAAVPQAGGVFDTLSGAPEFQSPVDPSQSSTFKTVCVRTCDGFYFPISYSTVPAKFQDDERTCQRMCPAAEAVLFAHRNPGEDISQALSIAGRPYTELPNAFRYRQQFSADCNCKRADETWANALKGVDDRAERGDIIVTDERAKTMSQPKTPPATSRDGRKGRGDAPAASTAAPASGETTAPPANVRPAGAIRSVGPKFYSAQ